MIPSMKRNTHLLTDFLDSTKKKEESNAKLRKLAAVADEITMSDVEEQAKRFLFAKEQIKKVHPSFNDMQACESRFKQPHVMCVGLDDSTGKATYFICTKDEWYDGGKEEQFRRIEPKEHWALISEAAMNGLQGSSPRTNDVCVFFETNKVSNENKCRLKKESEQLMRAINKNKPKAIKAPPKALKAMKVMKTMKAPKATKAVKAMKAMKATKAMT